MVDSAVSKAVSYSRFKSEVADQQFERRIPIGKGSACKAAHGEFDSHPALQIFENWPGEGNWHTSYLEKVGFTGSTPVLATKFSFPRVVKLAKALRSDRRDFVGSSPTTGTRFTVRWQSGNAAVC